MKPIYLDLPGVAAAISLSMSSIKNMVASGKFPRPRELSGRRVAWLVREIEEWCEARPVSTMLPVGQE